MCKIEISNLILKNLLDFSTSYSHIIFVKMFVTSYTMNALFDLYLVFFLSKKSKIINYNFRKDTEVITSTDEEMVVAEFENVTLVPLDKWTLKFMRIC